ncbi:ABC transporter permease [Arthrobacter sp. NPDC093128]|uniref:ABC transporter permease n=1 Tax=Arthrobacter sp. NPDC093128 TaxID=3154979 RepID=UPI00344268B7
MTNTASKPLSTLSAPEPPRFFSARDLMSFDRLRQYGLILALVILCVVFSFSTEYFFTPENLLNIARQVSVTAIVAVGMTFVIISGGIDLSVGANLAFSGVLATTVFASTGSPVLALLAGVGAGMALGLFNGILTAKGRITGFIVTLASMGAIRGFAFIVTGGKPVTASDKSFTFLGTGNVGGIAVPIIIMIIIVAAGAFLLNKTKFGKYVYAVGGNEKASRWTGLKVDRMQISVYALVGLLAGLAGVILAARLGSGQPFAGDGFELDVIAAVILGGSSLSGGRGKISGTIIGVLIIGVLNNGLTLLNVSSYWQMVVQGAIIITAVLIDRLARSKETK